MKEVKYLILGAGISGLAFAASKNSDEFLVIEQESTPGGLCRSYHEKGYTWDVSGHFFHYHSEKTKVYYDELMSGRPQRSVRKCAKVYYEGDYIDAPFQYNIHQLPKDEFIDCLTDLYYANDKAKCNTFDQYVKMKYGLGIATKFLLPYNEKLYACKMNDLEYDSMGKFLPALNFETLMEMYRGRIHKTYNDTFCYPVNGCEEIIKALISKIDRNRICFNEMVKYININERLVSTSTETYRWQYLVSTIPLLSYAKLIRCEGTNNLTSNKILVLNIGFDKPSINKEICWAYYPGNEIFYRVGFYNNIMGSDLLSIYVEISYSTNEEINLSDAIKKTMLDLKRVGIISEHKIVAYKAIVVNPGYVHITAKSEEFTKKLIEESENNNIYMIGRYARWQYSAMDDSMEQAIELAEKI